MKQKFILFLLISIVVVGIFLRFYKLSSNLIFDIDQSEDLFKLRQISTIISQGEFRNLPLKGEPGTYLIGEFNKDNKDYPVYTGVFYFYFLLPFAAITLFDPLGLTVVFTLFNLATVVVMYLVGKEFFNSRVGVIAALLTATSFWMNFFSRVIWTPSPAPLFVVLSLLFLAKIKKGSLTHWPHFLFSVSAVSQVHNSGYYFFLLFIFLIWVLKLSFPKKLSAKSIAILAFLIPILPTIAHEISTDFMLFPETFRAFALQISKYLGTGEFSIHSSLSVIGFILRDYFGFWVTTLNALQFNFYFSEIFGFTHPIIFAFFLIVSIISLFIPLKLRGNELWIKKFFLVFFATFLIVPFAVKRYYNDTSLGLFFGPGTFSIYAAMPIVILSVSYFLNLLIEKNKFTKIVAFIYIVLLSIVNILAIKHYIWENNDVRFNFSDKNLITEFIGKDTNNKDYSLTFSDPDYEGFEFIYLLDQNKIKRPTSYNGRNPVHTLMFTHYLTEAKPQIHYLIVAEPNWGQEVEGDYGLVFESGRFRVYRKDI